MKKSIIHSLSGLLFAIVATSCQSFLDKEPVDQLSPRTFFKSEADLALYTNSFYEQALPSALETVQADEMGEYTSKSNSPQFIIGSYSSIHESAWSWAKLRNINYFLANIHNPQINLETRNHYEGIARFFRAYFYFTMVKAYGDVPWHATPLDVNDEQLYKAQDPRTLVMDSVLADLDFTIANLRDERDAISSRVTRDVALAFKSRVCLFEGTFRKYHSQFGYANTADRWLEEAAAAAKSVMDAGRFSIYGTGNPATDYRTVFTTENPVATEVMWAIVYNNPLRRWHDVTWRFNSATYGSRWGLNKQFINTYLTLDGSPFTDRPGYDTIQFVREVDGRDYRLSQTIRTLGYKRSDGAAAPPNFSYTYTGYHIHKFSLDDRRLDGAAESYNSIPLIRFAEVLLNYAEAKAELGQFGIAEWNLTIAKLRRRAGVRDAVPDNADPYLKSTYFPDIDDKFLLEIRRERGVELVYEGHRYADLLRWKKGHLLEMQWKGIYVPAMDVPMDLDGNGTPDVIFVNTIPTGNLVPGMVYYAVDGNAAKLSEGTKGHIIWRDDETRVFDDKKYLRPISNADRVLNPNLKQNPGWQ